jgi:hypothetical protein
LSVYILPDETLPVRKVVPEVGPALPACNPVHHTNQLETRQSDGLFKGGGPGDGGDGRDSLAGGHPAPPDQGSDHHGVAATGGLTHIVSNIICSIATCLLMVMTVVMAGWLLYSAVCPLVWYGVTNLFRVIVTWVIVQCMSVTTVATTVFILLSLIHCVVMVYWNSPTEK